MGSFRMRFAVIVCFLTSTVVRSFGELIVLRHAPDNDGNTRKLTCISEGDDSALIWNDNSRTSEYQNFQPEKLMPKNFTECAIFNLSSCVAKWGKISKWKVVNSAVRPMGPVFDYRWEGFDEYFWAKKIGYQHVRKLAASTGSVVFSVRALQTVDVLLCKNGDATEDMCIRIIIGSSQGKKSEIAACNGVNCKVDGRVQHTTEVVNLYEWRTFRIERNKVKRKIRIFRNNEDVPFLEADVNIWPHEFHIFVMSEISSRFRFHFYEYFLTEEKGAELSTNPFIYGNEDFCVKLLVGLCSNCKLKIDLVDANGRSIAMKYTSGNKNDEDYKPVSWQWINLTATLQDFLSDVKVKIQTILDADDGRGQWAIDKLHACNSDGTLRKSTITIQRERTDSRVWPKVTCQKLSYGKGAVVDSSSTRTIEDDTNQLHQFVSGWKRNCGASCEGLGKKSSVCDPTGCVCDRGYRGIDCAEECTSGYYGYNCTEKCAPCDSGICEKANGYCYTGCQDKKLLPPLCREKLEEPTVVEITDTTVKVLQKVEVEAGFTGRVSAMIEDWYGWTEGYRRGLAPTYEIDLHGLIPNKTYVVYTRLFVTMEGVTLVVDSPKITFTTAALGDTCFKVIPMKKSLTLEYHREPEKCRNFLPKSYSVQLTSSGKIIGGPIASPPFPRNFTNLTAYTEYNITVFGISNPQLWTTTVRTLESAPGEVGNLQVQSKTDTTVILRWNAPEKKNGIIKKYNVWIQRESLLGCVDLKKETPKQDRMSKEKNVPAVFFHGLDPYAKYTVAVTAYTSEPGPVKFHHFETNERALATSVVSNLEYDDMHNRLEWEKPQNCTTISGSTKITRLIFEGVSDWVKNWNFTEETAFNYVHLSKLKLIPYTTYKVRAYVIRGYHGQVNPDFYQEKMWTTAPSAPPKVKDFDVFDANPKENSISLRWQPPYPSHGEIESYHVTITTGGRKMLVDKTVKVSNGTPMCKFRKNYVCLENVILPREIVNSTQLQIYAKNRDIDKPGEVSDVPFVLDEFYNKAPGLPRNVTANPQDNGVVMVTWMHPLFSRTNITRFEFHVKLLRTDLLHKSDVEYPVNHSYTVTQRQEEYRTMLHLLTSTDYDIFISAVDEHNRISVEIGTRCSTPGSIGLVSEAEPQVKFDGTLIEMKVPTVVNATRNTTLRIIVGGLSSCTPHQPKRSSPPVDQTISVTEWEAEVYQVGKNVPRSLTIYAKGHQGVTSNCTLDPGETYQTVFVATDWYSGKSVNLTVSPVSQQQNLASLIIFPIIAVCVLTLFIWHRNSRRDLKQPRPPTYLELIPYSSFATDEQNSPGLHVPNSSTPQHDAGKNQLSAHVYAVPDEPDSYSVSVENFEEHVKKAAANGQLHSQFMLLPRGLTRPCEYGSIPENMQKNRNPKLIAYDDTRVVLNKIPGEPYSDYINASYIKGFHEERSYIAAQGPMPNTVKDFWRMIWQEEVRVICMLTNVVEGTETKCEKYWPDLRTTTKYGDFVVSTTGVQVFADYTFRTFILDHRHEIRKVTHLHYTGWPTLRVPEYSQSLVAYVKKLDQTPTGNGPVLVHCSTGDDRTGTIILCDICVRQAVKENVIDVRAVATRLRDSRANMVGNLQQYVLAHIIISERLVPRPTQIPCTRVLLKRIEQNRVQLPSDIRRLNDTMWQDETLRSSAAPRPPTAACVSIDNLPEMIISDNPGGAHGNNQLNVLSVDGVSMKKQYLATWIPTQLTLFDFWKVVAKRNVKLIIMLQCSDPTNPTCCDIVPDESITGSALGIRVEVEDQTRLEEKAYFTNEKLFSIDTLEKNAERQIVTVLTCRGWGCGDNGNPPTPAALVALWIAAERIPRKEDQTLVLCHDGIRGCGLYLALSFLLERMAVEKECDVISAVRAVRRSKPEFVQTLEQFEFLYDAAVEYVETFQTYANFS